MMLRRVHQLPNGDEVLVTVQGDAVEVAHRAHSWDVWSPPLDLLHATDDPADALPRYDQDGRTYGT